ncbi:hypothetical protein GCM10007298_38240 [Williamsia phyllosphaerae]|uniref:Uncharacterized protein n=1 Tax=Williamsia phyllosphaerae TaxID=885042 RepID=A0ABQ1V702_9NOCA|nr:hypothetical protein GCM10007298_38240 [Williamsia phyllosphaerae]
MDRSGFTHRRGSPTECDPLRPSQAVGVASKDEAPLTPVWCPDVGRSKALPLRVIPERGQVADCSGKLSENNDGWHVLQHDVSRS